MTRGRISTSTDVEADRLHGVEFLVHLHRADLRGEGRPDRPAMMIAVISTPISRSTPMPSALTV